jgi:hypothetical protein
MLMSVVRLGGPALACARCRAVYSWGSWDGGPELAAEHAAADSAALLERLREEVAAEKERRARHEARWDEILHLPQLFIAG